MRLTLAEIAKCLHAPAPTDACLLTGVAIDSRSCRPGDLFFCLPGERVDGHAFAAKAVANGALAVIASRPLPDISAPVLQVANTELALGELAAYWRSLAKAKVVCITGTAGKTTLKDSLATILGEAGAVAASNGNHNNQIGLPLTILGANGDEKFWVLEAGISHAGDMEYLGKIAQPDLAIILNVGPGHTEGLGLKGVAWHKTRLLNYLAPAGMGLISCDYPELVAEADRASARFSTFGVKNKAAIFSIDEQNAGCLLVDCAGKKEKYNAPPYPGSNPENMLAAIAAAKLLGIPCEAIQAGLNKSRPPEQRFNLEKTGSFYLIDDTYNANPLSMNASINAARKEADLKELPLILVLGEMGELGDDSARLHKELGDIIASAQPHTVFWKGAWFNEITKGVNEQIEKTSERAKKQTPPRLLPLSSPEDLPELLKAASPLPKEAVILFKGSRSNRLEDFLSRFRAFAGAEDVL